MAWNPSPKVADCRNIARKWGGKEQVIIIGIDGDGNFEAASYGQTPTSCRCAEVLMREALAAIEQRVQKV